MLTVENTNFYDLNEVERKLNVTKPTLLRWIKNGKLNKDTGAVSAADFKVVQQLNASFADDNCPNSPSYLTIYVKWNKI